MRVKIGKYCNYVGPYQLSDTLKYVGFSEDTCDKIGEYLASTKLTDICQWIYEKRKRKVEIHVDDYDIWSLYETISQIILPCLKLLKENTNGVPFVDDEDVPDELKNTFATPKEKEYHTDKNWFKRWDYILDEMIWTFEQLQPDCDWETQYHTGDIDVYWKKCKDNPLLSEMMDGPEDTYVFNRDGYEKHQAKISNGLRLFGRYFQNLWT